jgi:hypothetical protein
MRLLTFCAAALGLTCARALTVPDVFEKIEQNLPTRDAPPPKYFRKLEPYTLAVEFEMQM